MPKINKNIDATLITGTIVVGLERMSVRSVRENNGRDPDVWKFGKHGNDHANDDTNSIPNAQRRHLDESYQLRVSGECGGKPDR